MASKSETVLQALASLLAANLPPGAVFRRNESVPHRIPAAGVVILQDGDPGPPEALFSPPVYLYEHRAEVDIVCDRATAANVDAAFDAVKTAIGSALAANRTLGGLCDYVLGEAPAPLELNIEGAEGLKAATLVIVLIYGSSDPLL